MDFLDFDFGENINPYNVDLNNLEREYHDRDTPIEDERQKTIQLDTNLREIFPDADEALYKNEASKRRQQFFPYSFRTPNEGEILTKLDKDEIPQELEFFSGGAENVRSLFSRIDSHNLNRGNEDFVNFLGTEECQEALQRDGISIHVPTGNIFINNQNTEKVSTLFLIISKVKQKKKYPLIFHMMTI